MRWCVTGFTDTCRKSRAAISKRGHSNLTPVRHRSLLAARGARPGDCLLQRRLRAWIARAKTAATAASWSRRRRSRVLTPGGADIISVTCTAAFGVPIVAGLSRDDFTQIAVQRVSIPVAAAKKVLAMLAPVEREKWKPAGAR